MTTGDLTDRDAPKPYVCTVLIEMPADMGEFTPADVAEFLTEHGASVLEWHDEKLIGDDE